MNSDDFPRETMGQPREKIITNMVKFSGKHISSSIFVLLCRGYALQYSAHSIARFLHSINKGVTRSWYYLKLGSKYTITTPTTCHLVLERTPSPDLRLRVCALCNQDY